jgi:hypothetical protein
LARIVRSACGRTRYRPRTRSGDIAAFVLEASERSLEAPRRTSSQMVSRGVGAGWSDRRVHLPVRRLAGSPAWTRCDRLRGDAAGIHERDWGSLEGDGVCASACRRVKSISRSPGRSAWCWSRALVSEHDPDAGPAASDTQSTLPCAPARRARP